jgi:hypothetical protein
MLIKRKSMITGIVREKDLDITVEQLKSWENGRSLIQQAFPQLNDDDREFILTGIVQDEWDEFIKENPEEEK